MLDVTQARIRIGERQVEHGIHAPVRLRQHLLGDPAAIGPAQVDLHLLLRMRAKAEHAGREQAGVIDPHRVHPALTELDVADAARLGLLGGAQRIAGDAAAHVLIADHLRQQAVARAALHRQLAQHVVFHERKNFAHVLVFIMMRVDIDDHEVVELAQVRLLARMRQKPGGVEFIDRDAPAAISNEVHGVPPNSTNSS